MEMRKRTDEATTGDYGYCGTPKQFLHYYRLRYSNIVSRFPSFSASSSSSSSSSFFSASSSSFSSSSFSSSSSSCPVAVGAFAAAAGHRRCRPLGGYRGEPFRLPEHLKRRLLQPGRS